MKRQGSPAPRGETKRKGKENSKKMEPTIYGLYSILGLYWDNGKGHGICCIIYWGYVGITEKKMEATA